MSEARAPGRAGRGGDSRGWEGQAMGKEEKQIKTVVQGGLSGSLGHKVSPNCFCFGEQEGW